MPSWTLSIQPRLFRTTRASRFPCLALLRRNLSSGHPQIRDDGSQSLTIEVVRRTPCASIHAPPARLLKNWLSL